jgi:hypothetical protein
MAYNIALGSPGSGFDISLTTTTGLTLDVTETATATEVISFILSKIMSNESAVATDIPIKALSIVLANEGTVATDIPVYAPSIVLREDATSTDTAPTFNVGLVPGSESVITSEGTVVKDFSYFISNENVVTSEVFVKSLSVIFNEAASVSDFLTSLLEWLILRLTKGIPLTATEVDANFNGMNARKLQISVDTITTSSSYTPAASTTAVYITALASVLVVNAKSGTPLDGESLCFHFKDNGTTQTLSWDASYRAIGVTLPNTTIAGKWLYVDGIYNAADSKWDILSVTDEV